MDIGHEFEPDEFGPDIHAACDYPNTESGVESGYVTHSDSSHSPPSSPEDAPISHPLRNPSVDGAMNSRKWSTLTNIYKNML